MSVIYCSNSLSSREKLYNLYWQILENLSRKFSKIFVFQVIMTWSRARPYYWKIHPCLFDWISNVTSPGLVLSIHNTLSEYWFLKLTYKIWYIRRESGLYRSSVCIILFTNLQNRFSCRTFVLANIVLQYDSYYI